MSLNVLVLQINTLEYEELSLSVYLAWNAPVPSTVQRILQLQPHLN